MATLFEPIVAGMTTLFGREPTLNEMILIPMIPVFVSGFLFEWLYSYRKTGDAGLGQGKPFWLREVLANFSLGAGYYVSGALMNLLFVAALFSVVWEHRLFTIPLNLATVILAFFAQEFCYYWYHRSAHRIRWFWTQHVSHHTGEIMNMSTACLLYTSPSPRDRTRSRMPSSA